MLTIDKSHLVALAEHIAGRANTTTYLLGSGYKLHAISDFLGSFLSFLFCESDSEVLGQKGSGRRIRHPLNFI